MRGTRGYHMLGRRDLAAFVASLAAGCAGGGRSPGTAPEAGGRGTKRVATGTPAPSWGVQSGDVSASRAVIWSRSDRPSRMIVEWSTEPNLTDARVRRVVGPMVSVEGGLVAKAAIDGLPPGGRIHYRVRFEEERASEWITGALSTPPDTADARESDVVFAWSGDTNGQGWGIDESRGGMPAYTALLERAPDFFVSCGDAIYADGPILPEVALPDGTVWRNLVTDAKSHAAETLEDFRGNHLYARLSREVRALSAQVPSFAIWDDHEVRNNWFPGDATFDALAVHARRAMLEYTPTLLDPAGVMYRSFRWGPMLEVFLLDGRSHRTPNHPAPPKEAFLGAAQLAWLEGALARSTATWKVIASNMPVGLVVSEPAPGAPEIEAFDGFGNGNGPPHGREDEVAALLTSLKRRGIRNVVWLTADVHYAAAHRYDPARAVFKDMDPFWEFVAGPMHATSFPRKRLDDTFGPEVVYASAGGHTFGSPADGAQYFGVIRIDGKTRVMTVTLVDGRGRDLHATLLRPA